MGDNHQEDEPRPGNYDRAWNDPPLFSYSSTSAKTAGAAAAGQKLNKRIGFPGSTSAPPPPPSAATSSGPPAAKLPPSLPPTSLHDAGARSVKAPQGLPPPPPTGAPPVAAKPGGGQATGRAQEGEVDLDDVMEKLTGALERSTLDERRKADVRKRTEAMAAKWKGGGLNPQVHAGLRTIADGLSGAEREGVEAAEKAQLGLIVDWPALCGTWLVGIKHLVADAKKGAEPYGGDDGGAGGVPTPGVISQPLGAAKD